MATASIIIPTRNMETSISHLLESIFSQEYNGEIEVLIMDSSDDMTPQIAQAFPVRIIRVEPEDYNYGKTRNEGAAIVRGDFLVFISADVEIADRRWLSKLTSHFADPKVAGVYGRQLPEEGAAPMDQFFILHAYPPESATLEVEGGKIRTRRLVFFSNTNSAIRRSIWEQIKIPEMLKSEDHEWAKRALLAGYKIVYDDAAGVYHTNSYSLKKVFHEHFDTGATIPVINRERVVDQSLRRFVLEGVGYVYNEYIFMLRHGHWRSIPYAIAYDTAKSLGILLGSGQQNMPLWMKRVLCKKKNHWDKYSDVIKEPASPEKMKEVTP